MRRLMRVFFVVVALLTLLPDALALQPAVPTVESYWSGGSGNWNSSSKWLPSPAVPNNTRSTNYAVTVHGDMVTVNTPVVVSALTVGVDRFLDMRQRLTTDSFVLERGYVIGPQALRVNGDLVLKRGYMNTEGTGTASLYVGGDVVKQGYGRAFMAPFEGGGDYEIKIQEGSLGFGNGGQGSSGSGISVTNREFARIFSSSLNSITDDVSLNNAKGFGHTGAIFAASDTLWVQGDIDLGNEGSVLSAASRMRFNGAIHGGSLDLIGGGVFEFYGGNHDYSGATHVGQVSRATVQLRSEGALESSSGLHLYNRSSLLLRNTELTLSDRVGDTMPIYLSGGGLAFDGNAAETIVERAGPLNLVSGASDLTSTYASTGWAFPSLNRSPEATVNFRVYESSAIVHPSILFDTPPLTENSILGGWTTHADADFVTYESTLGVIPLGSRVARPNQIEGANSHSHVRITGTPLALTADRTIATLAGAQYGRVFNLGGHLLTLGDGGLIAQNDSAASPRFTNGQLTAGRGHSEARLFLHVMGSGLATEISADIVDNPLGDSISLIKAGGGMLRLAGNNTFSGTTVIQEGTLTLEAPNALSDQADVWVDGGSLGISIDTTTFKSVGTLRLTGGGSVHFVDQETSGVDAREYLLENGRLEVPLAGDGSMRKTSVGWVELDKNSPGYVGEVSIDAGVLATTQATPDALGGGLTTILPGGTLNHGSRMPGTASYLLNANLRLAGGDVALGRGVAGHLYHFGGAWEVTAPSRLLMFQLSGEDGISGGPLPGYAHVKLLKATVLADGGELAILGEGLADFVGGVHVAGDSVIDLRNVSATLASVVATAPAPTLQVRGSGQVNLPSTAGGQVGTTLRLEIQQGIELNTPPRGTTLPEGVTLALDGLAAPGSLLLLSAGTLQGHGTADRVVNVGGTVAPGNSIGELAIREYVQEVGGILSLEIAAGVDPAHDLLRGDAVGLRGVVEVHLLPGSQPMPGSTYDLVIANTLWLDSPNFVTHEFLGEFDVVTIDSGIDAGRWALRLTIVPEPSASLLFAGGLAVALVRWRK